MMSAWCNKCDIQGFNSKPPSIDTRWMDVCQVASTAAAAVWGFATTSGSRRRLLQLGVIPAIYRNIQRSLSLAVVVRDAGRCGLEECGGST